MQAVLHGALFLIKAYLQLVLYVPRVLIELNLAWNPFFIIARKLFQRAFLTMEPASTSTKVPVPAATGSQSEDETVPLDVEEVAEAVAEGIAPVPKSEMRWLEPGEYNGEHIAIVSYPRSGNSLMRGLLEKVTGVYTGCDTRPDRTLSQQLQEFGMKGEGIVDDSVWFVKTHFPERVGWKSFNIQKAILVVRNPWDAIDSYFNMTLTNSHNKSLHESQYERFADRWDGMLRNEIEVWMKFHRYWTSKVDIPIIVVRYEDLLIHRAETLRRVFLFLTDRPSIEGTEWETRIKNVMETSGENSGPYVPRSGKIGASFKHYSDEQFQHILKVANLPLRGFGYDPVTQNFPNDIQLPRRQVKPGKTPDAVLEVPIDPAQEIRKRNDAYGRYSTWYRKGLTDPVIANDGTELNMDEVLQARQKAEEDKAKAENRNAS
ncbi:hypothetical protein Poli38472_003830 [Pythium oligandrum]|uniref:Sulfotransferase domain-containing protein n=1 Tax=Pythium oligandrum TaxID=41045 RepID=A0A8K1CNX2_PYTOL|nr:hypothetical protein Poli38472_003830 [Pythium oligandrum]|eukprot:TMW66065.1 hypothetical protein Poli38472_003830 [Pythium oligandrum]